MRTICSYIASPAMIPGGMMLQRPIGVPRAPRPALDELRAANAKAIDMLKSACPKDLPSIPTGRLAALESRLQVMLAAVQTVRPALERFYQSLSDEQKARFNAIASADNPDAAGKDRRDLTKFCDEK